MKTEDRLMEMKRRIEELKTKKAQAEGAIKQISRELKDDFGCRDLKDAKAKLESMKAELEETERKIEKQIEKLDKDYEWEEER